MRIAICFSGHIRNFLTHGIFNLNSNILSLREHGHVVDLFISTWDTINAGSEDKIDTDKIKELNPIICEIENYDLIKHNFLLKNFHSNLKMEFGKSQNDFVGIKNGILNSTPMFYKIYKANKLKCAYEVNNGFKYDIVIRYRANLSFLSPICIDNFKPNVIYNRGICGKIDGKSIRTDGNINLDSYMFDDLFAYGDSNIMNIYSDVYNNLSILFHEYGSTGPERILYDWVVLKNTLRYEKISQVIELCK